MPTFAQFFEAVTGHTPYVWQDRAATDLAACNPLEQISVPTGMGKTSLMHAWLWALAADTARLTRAPQQTRRVPMRYAVVVDRRAVVDDTTATAHRLAHALAQPTNQMPPALAAIAQILQGLGAGDPVLEVRQLRGGMPDKPENVRHPATPAIIVGTIDLVLSRLLWRGYGVAPARRPIEAALVGIDCLIVLDEAHIATQAMTTLRILERQAREETRFEGTVPARQIIEMTATPHTATRPFDFEAEFAARPELRAARERRRATPVCIVNTGAKTGDAGLMKVVTKIPLEPGRMTLVYANTPATVKKLAAAFAKAPVAKQTPHRAHAVIGGMPEYAGARTLAGLDAYRTGNPERIDALALALFTNQALEVGADLDADYLITAICSLAALVQRLGREDRVGARGTGTIIIVVGAGEAEPVYGQAAADLGAALLKRRPADLGQLEDFLAAGPADQWNPPAPIPAVIPRHDFTAYTATAGSPHEVPVGRWLRAPQDQAVEIQVAFRDSLTQIADPAVLVAHISACPPQPGEIWTVPLPAAAALLTQATKNGRRVLLLDPTGTQPPVLDPVKDDLQPGWILVAAPTTDAFDLPGAGADLLAILDPTRKPFTLVPETAPPAEHDEGEGDEEGARAQKVAGYLAAARAGNIDAAAAYLAAGGEAGDLAPVFTAWPLTDAAGEATGWVQVRRTRGVAETIPTRPVSLTEHQELVGAIAKHWAKAVGLPTEVVEDIATAGLHHDDGKCAPVVQTELRYTVNEAGELSMLDPVPGGLAKSLLPRRWWPRVRALSGIPRLYRHEAGSAQELDVALAQGTVQAHDAELVRHLVLTHHGFFRGPGPAIEDAAVPIPIYQDPTATQWTDRVDEFAALSQRYGPYTLALAETIVRLADWQGSREHTTDTAKEQA